MIHTEHSHLRVAALSHPGASGKNNEDRFAVSSYQVSADRPIPSLFAVVSDGIGGHRAGEVAAEMAVNTISHFVAQSDASHPIQILQEAVSEASQAISAHAQSDASLHGMGATCACTWVIGGRLYTASIGDSRIYLIRKGRVWRLTTDHTWVQEALDRGVLTPEQAQGHPNMHIIHRYLGSPQPPNVDVRLRVGKGESDTQARSNQGMRLSAGDVLLLCTDGLTDLVSDEEMVTQIHGENLTAEAQALVDLANDRGGHDNITVILLAVPQPAKKQLPGTQLPWLMAMLIGCMLLVAISICVWTLFQP